MLDCTATRKVKRMKWKLPLTVLATLFAANSYATQAPHVPPPPHNSHRAARETAAPNARPKLVVLLVIDQMRGDYVDKFRSQWTGGLKRLLDEGAWFRQAAYPYAATETCLGHATISTGALPATHGIVGNTWWDRGSQSMVTCTADPNVKNVAYSDGTATGGDSAWRMRVPAFAD